MNKGNTREQKEKTMPHGVGHIKISGLKKKKKRFLDFIFRAQTRVCLCVQLTLVQPGFEACRPTHMQIFSHKYSTVL